MTVLGIIMLISAAIALAISRRTWGFAPIAALLTGFGFKFLDWPYSWIGFVAAAIGFVFLIVRWLRASDWTARLGIAIMVIIALFAVPSWGSIFDDDDDKVETNDFALGEISCDGDFRATASAERQKVKEASESDLINTDQAGDFNAQIHDRIDECESAAEQGDEVAEATGLSDEDAGAIARQIPDTYQGFEPGELQVGVGEIPDSPEERGAASFTDDTIEVRENLPVFFDSDHPKARAARDRVEAAIRAAGYGDDEVNHALTSGDRWIWIAPTVEHQILGTTYYVDGEVVKADNWRQAASKDAIWYYITRDAKFLPEASVRADCGNPNVDKVRPVRPGTPPAPPIDVPPGQETPPPTAPPGTTPPVTTPPTTEKPRTSTECQQNGTNCPPGVTNDVVQPVQENPSGVNTGPTPGAPSSPPTTSAPGPTAQPNQPAPPPNDGGYDSGSPDGSNTPGGSTCDNTGCSTTPTTQTTSPPPTVDNGTHDGDPGGF